MVVWETSQQHQQRKRNRNKALARCRIPRVGLQLTHRALHRRRVAPRPRLRRRLGHQGLPGLGLVIPQPAVLVRRTPSLRTRM